MIAGLARRVIAYSALVAAFADCDPALLGLCGPTFRGVYLDGTMLDSTQTPLANIHITLIEYQGSRDSLIPSFQSPTGANNPLRGHVTSAVLADSQHAAIHTFLLAPSNAILTYQVLGAAWEELSGEQADSLRSRLLATATQADLFTDLPGKSRLSAPLTRSITGWHQVCD